MMKHQPSVKNSETFIVGNLVVVHLRKAVNDQSAIVGYVKRMTNDEIVMNDDRRIDWSNVDNVHKLNLDDGPTPYRQEIKLL